MEASAKVYVSVDVNFNPEGHIRPICVQWEDGRKYNIDAVTDVRRQASMKAGGAGIRYRVRIGNKETNLFLEENRWFVERKQ